MAAVMLAGCGGGDDAGPIQDAPEIAVVEPPDAAEARVMDKQELTVLDQRITYPKQKPARISSEVIVLQPGESTGWRAHQIPVYVHVLSGTYTIDYDEGALVEYPAGSAFIQALKTDYNGMNEGEVPVSVLHVYLGAKGLQDIIER